MGIVPTDLQTTETRSRNPHGEVHRFISGDLVLSLKKPNIKQGLPPASFPHPAAELGFINYRDVLQPADTVSLNRDQHESKPSD